MDKYYELLYVLFPMEDGTTGFIGLSPGAADLLSSLVKDKKLSIKQSIRIVLWAFPKTVFGKTTATKDEFLADKSKAFGMEFERIPWNEAFPPETNLGGPDDKE